MQIEPVRLLGGETGRDFVLIDDSGTERFSARLMDGSRQLTVTWTDNLPRTVLRLRDVQQLTGAQAVSPASRAWRPAKWKRPSWRARSLQTKPPDCFVVVWEETGGFKSYLVRGPGFPYLT